MHEAEDSFALCSRTDWRVPQADPNTTLQALIDAEADTNKVLRAAHRHHLQQHIHSAPQVPEPVKKLLPSLLSPLTSIALATLPQTDPAHRLNTTTFTQAMRRKLRLPVTQATTCPCGKPFDAYGDHAYQCKNHSKHAPHNRIRDSLYLALKHTVPFTDIAYEPTDVAREPTGLLPQQPTFRPANVAIHMREQQHSHLLIEITCIPVPPVESV